ncbi:GGDEF domain-containing protein [Ancylobacter terrae]|uniref:GGDEF domain-containing protein n=1 Tax=Ancylobacter sp. sgz301288 TaxID=3342077 RepID=UPI00385B92A0
MPLDPLTLWAVILLVGVVLSGVMLLAWWLTPTEVALGYWAMGIALLVSGMAMGVARPLMNENVSIVVGNAAILAAYGLLWSGMRRFDGRDAGLAAALAAAAIWPFICLLPPFRDSVSLRFVALTVLICAMLVMTIAQLWRSRSGHLRARRTVIALFAGLLMLNLVRLAMVGFVEQDGKLILFSSPAFAWFGLMAAALTTFVSFALVIMVRERSEQRYLSASVVDDLTGLLNRRGFLQEANRSFPPQGPVAVLMMDLDGFKQVNDRLGHAEGDRVLAVFANVLRENLRQIDVAGRVGGEEFGALLPNQGLADAGRAAERIRRAFLEAAGLALMGKGSVPPLRVSVSIGVSATERSSLREGASVEALLRAMMTQADRQLYRAKDNGRNRVELSVFDPNQIDSVA